MKALPEYVSPVPAVVVAPLDTRPLNTARPPFDSDGRLRVLEKVAKLMSSDTSAQCDVELGRTTEHHNKGNIFRAEIHVTGANKNFYASTEQADLYAAIDIVRDDIVREVTAGRAKRLSLVRRSGARVKNMMRGLWPWRKKV